MPVMLFLRALPLWVKVGAGMGLLLGVMQLMHWWNTRDLKRDLESTRQELKQTQQEAAGREIAIQQAEVNRQTLEAEIENQNRRINGIASQARQAQATAALAAMREIQAGKVAAEELRKPTTDVEAGPEGMNAYLDERFPHAK